MEGSFDINDNIGLTQINGLEELKGIGGRFTIENNIDLADLSGFNNLVDIGVKLDISRHDSLKLSISGLNILKH